MNSQTEDITHFYGLLDRLEQTLNGSRQLAQCHGRLKWPRKGVYFFREDGERRSTSGSGPKIVRVGTHALKAGSQSSLWNRLSQHRGPIRTVGGNHRGSIFRLLVGTALIERDGLEFPTWGIGSSASREVRRGEVVLEQAVSNVIGSMSVLWIAIEDEPGPDSLRGFIERNAIALLSNHNKKPLDPPSRNWLGHCCNRVRVKSSGLWNQNHVDEDYDPEFLIKMERLICEMEVNT